MDLETLLGLLGENPEAVEFVNGLNSSVSNLENKNKEILNERKTQAQKAKELEEQIKAYQALGKTPDEINALVSRQQELEENQMIAKGDYEKLLQKKSEEFEALKAQLQEKMQGLENTIAEKDSKIWDLGVGNKTLEVLSTGDYRVANPSQMLTLLGKSRKDDEKGVFQGEDGLPHYRISAIESRPLTEQIKLMSDDPNWSHHFLANIGSGSGVKPGNSIKTGDVGENPFETGNATKQQDLIVKDPDLARTMAKAAGKKAFW